MKVETQSLLTNTISSSHVNDIPKAQPGIHASVRQPTQDNSSFPSAGKVHDTPSHYWHTNQFVSGLQASGVYLDELSSRLTDLKLKVSEQVGLGQPNQKRRESIANGIKHVNQIFAQRTEQTGQLLDRNLNISLHEPARVRFTVQGLDSLQSIQSSGKETLVVHAGQSSAEPIVVFIEDNMDVKSLLNTLNKSFQRADWRVELSGDDRLQFSTNEKNWSSLQQKLRIKGEEGLFPAAGAVPLVGAESGVTQIDEALAQGSTKELRQLLDGIVTTLNKVGRVREYIHSRQEEEKIGLSSQGRLQDGVWAEGFVDEVFKTDHRKGKEYQVADVIANQAQLSRQSVVNVLDVKK